MSPRESFDCAAHGARPFAFFIRSPPRLGPASFAIRRQGMSGGSPPPSCTAPLSAAALAAWVRFWGGVMARFAVTKIPARREKEAIVLAALFNVIYDRFQAAPARLRTSSKRTLSPSTTTRSSASDRGHS